MFRNRNVDELHNFINRTTTRHSVALRVIAFVVVVALYNKVYRLDNCDEPNPVTTFTTP